MGKQEVKNGFKKGKKKEIKMLNGPNKRRKEMGILHAVGQPHAHAHVHTRTHALGSHVDRPEDEGQLIPSISTCLQELKQLV